MMIARSARVLQLAWLPVSLLALYLAAIFFRPLLPIDETRYMSVAWEMLLHKGWFNPLTMNFAPYHHKPPLLFWLINMSWFVFGVSRWAGLIPIVLSSLICVYLTAVMARLLFPLSLKDQNRTALVMTASVPFMIYSTLVMFDMTLTVFILLSLLFVVKQSREPALRYLILSGIFLGLGVLTKGPVAYLYVLPTVILAPLWMKNFSGPLSWYGGLVLIVMVSAVPVLFWLIPVLKQSDANFAFWLLWNQTAGRVTGNFSDAHIRPIYFYLPLLPVMVMPWIFLPEFWRDVSSFWKNIFEEEGQRFLLCWILPAFVAFCMISGKQPHYLLPFLPATAIFSALRLRNFSDKSLYMVFITMTAVVIISQAIAAQTFLRVYNLQPIAGYMRQHPDHDWAFVNNYHAEMGFLARLEKPMMDVSPEDIVSWFEHHPNGLAVIHYKNPADVSAYIAIFDEPYKERRVGIFKAKKIDASRPLK